jgi:repressor LexA
METVGERIKKIRIEKGYTLDDLAKCVKSTRQNIYKYENNIITNIPNDNVEKIALFLHVDPAYLMGWTNSQEEVKDDQQIISIRIPLYSPICCGNGGFTEDNITDYISLPSNMLNNHYEYFAQIANGNSMIGEGIKDGDILVFKKSGHIDNGKIGCFCIDDNYAMCKKYHVTNDKKIVLLPANDKFDPILVDVENEHFRCIGVLAYSLHKH